VSVNSSYQSDFQYVVADFLSSIMPENYVGFVSASVDQRTLSGQCPSPSYECGTGVFLGGRVDFVNGRLQASAGSRLDITGSSKLVIQVMDYIPNQPQIAPIPPIYLPNAEGFVQGNRAYLVFWDNYGFVYMEGQFDNQWFTGRIEYENYE